MDFKKAADAAGSGRKIQYSIPREGAPVWVESLVLLRYAPNSQQGVAFIDYMLRPEVVAQSSNFTPTSIRMPGAWLMKRSGTIPVSVRRKR